jgi:hypothetical protein
VLGGKTAIIGEDGKAGWEYDGGSRDGFVLPNGNVLIAYSDRVEEVTRDKQVVFSADIEAVLKRRPAVGQLFPYLCTVRAGDRATEFKQRCDGLEISGMSLHCYRYAWAERALKVKQ